MTFELQGAWAANFSSYQLMLLMMKSHVAARALACSVGAQGREAKKFRGEQINSNVIISFVALLASRVVQWAACEVTFSCHCN